MNAGNRRETDPTAGQPLGSESGARCRLAVLISGRGSNLQALIEACAQGRIDGRIVRVVSNRPEAPGLQFARQAQIPHAVVDHREHADRPDFERALGASLESCDPDLIVLAGFMRILTPAFVARFPGRMVNIHPSLLPAFRGRDTHARVLAAGQRTHGASVHFVTAELDGGPVLMQGQVPVHPGDTAEGLAARVQATEHRLYPAAVGLICSGRIQVAGDRVLCDGQPMDQPLRLDDFLKVTS
jgi:phosphoribosylglycinamide formyltransferase 1